MKKKLFLLFFMLFPAILSANEADLLLPNFTKVTFFNGAITPDFRAFFIIKK